MIAACEMPEKPIEVPRSTASTENVRMSSAGKRGIGKALEVGIALPSNFILKVFVFRYETMRTA
jgi:hypothetical protein